MIKQPKDPETTKKQELTDNLRFPKRTTKATSQNRGAIRKTAKGTPEVHSAGCIRYIKEVKPLFKKTTVMVNQKVEPQLKDKILVC